jgi:hypothetical protein
MNRFLRAYIAGHFLMGVMMTKPVVCRILDSRPLECPQIDAYDPYPALYRRDMPRSAVVAIPLRKGPRESLLRPYQSEILRSRRIPKGTWIDLIA